MLFHQDISYPVEPELFGLAYPIPHLLPFHPSSFLPSCFCVVCLEVFGSVKISYGRRGGGGCEAMGCGVVRFM